MLLSLFDPQTVTSATSRMTELSSIRMSADESVDDFVLHIRTLAILLVDQNHVIPELLLATYAMKGLDHNRSKAIVRMFALGKTVLKTLDEVTSELNEYESRLALLSDGAATRPGKGSHSGCACQASSSTSTPTAIADSTFGNTNLSDSKAREGFGIFCCFLYKTNEHAWVKCPILSRNWEFKKKDLCKSSQIQSSSDSNTAKDNSKPSRAGRSADSGVSTSKSENMFAPLHRIQVQLTLVNMVLASMTWLPRCNVVLISLMMVLWVIRMAYSILFVWVLFVLLANGLSS